jgi:hypothetical protein
MNPPPTHPGMISLVHHRLRCAIIMVKGLMEMLNIRRIAWSHDLEKRIERMLRTGVFIGISAITCLLAVFWYISPN